MVTAYLTIATYNFIVSVRTLWRRSSKGLGGITTIETGLVVQTWRSRKIRARNYFLDDARFATLFL